MSLYRKYKIAKLNTYIGTVNSFGELDENANLGSISLIEDAGIIAVKGGSSWEVIDSGFDLPIKRFLPRTAEEADYEDNVVPFLNYVRVPEGTLDFKLTLCNLLKVPIRFNHTSRFNILS